MRSVLVLGGTGAMGSYLVDKLCNRYDVFVTSRRGRKSMHKNVHYLCGNAHDLLFLREVLSKRYYFALIDFMLYTTDEFNERHELLLNGTDHYLFISSARVFAENNSAINEDSPRLLEESKSHNFLKSDDYALTKARQEDILHRSGFDNYTIIRPYMTYFPYRLDMGFYAKEMWLYRVLKGRTVLFPKDVYEKKTTLTFGGDVAEVIACLINLQPKGEIFNITTNENIAWKDVIDMYIQELKWHGYNVKLRLVEKEIIETEYIYKYDRKFDRVFDNVKIQHVCPMKYVEIREGVRKCISDFLKKPVFKEIDWKRHAYWDRISGESTPMFEISGIKNKCAYLLFRHILPYKYAYEVNQIFS